jgi:hypothetical protein
MILIWVLNFDPILNLKNFDFKQLKNFIYLGIQRVYYYPGGSCFQGTAHNYDVNKLSVEPMNRQAIYQKPDRALFSSGEKLKTFQHIESLHACMKY